MNQRCWISLILAGTILPILAFVGPVSAEIINFGNYHALLIANENYTNWGALRTPHEDVDDLEEVLREKYGFTTNVIKDATRDDIIDELEALKGSLTEHDNLLIYFAGHGKIRNDDGYWIGVDATRNSPSRWLHFHTINRLIDAEAGMRARHLLVIADSCYSGAALRDEDANSSRGANETYHKWLERVQGLQSRQILTSGGTEPVLDGSGNGRNSVFASELLSRLSSNNDVLGGFKVHDLIKVEVHSRARRIMGSDAQSPEFGRIPGTGHKGGEFFFVPQGSELVALPARNLGIHGSGIRGQLGDDVGGPLFESDRNAQSAVPRVSDSRSLTWELVISDRPSHRVEAVFPTSDGGVVGAMRFSEPGFPRNGVKLERPDPSIWFVKIDRMGREEWVSKYLVGYSQVTSIAQTLDGGFVLVGYGTKLGDRMNIDGWALKVDASGKEQWIRYFGSPYFDAFEAVASTEDGGVAVAGWTETDSIGGRDGWLLKLDAKGVEEWQQRFGWPHHDEVHSVVQTKKGGFALAGMTEGLGDLRPNGWLVRTDATGKELSIDEFKSRDFDAPEISRFVDVIELGNGDLILSGWAQEDTGWADEDTTSSGRRAWLVKVDSQGDEKWNRTYGGSEAMQAHAVAPIPEGGVVLIGNVRRKESETRDALILIVDEEGDQLFRWYYGSRKSDEFLSIASAPMGGYFIGGVVSGEESDTLNKKISGGQGWVLKVNTDGAVVPRSTRAVRLLP